jgi:cob(I)alamin adenosyltransferase
MPRIYTRTGDDGTTGRLFGGRVSKGGALAEAVGCIDELVAALGLARALCSGDEGAEELLGLQRELFVVAADLAANPEARPRLEPGVSLVTDEMVARLENRIDALVAASPLPDAFVVPGANPGSASLDVARAAARRVERAIVRLREEGEPAADPVARYANRLSDLLFVLGRRAAGESEPRSRDGG